MPGVDACPPFDSSVCQISLFIHHRTHKPFSSQKNTQTDERARRCPHQSSALSVYEVPTLPLSIAYTLLLVTPVVNAFILASAASPIRYDTVSPHASDQSRSSHACQTPLWLRSQILRTYRSIRHEAFDVRASGYL